MIVAYEADIRKLARSCFAKAKGVATAISLSQNAQFSESVKYARAIESRDLNTELAEEKIETFHGLKGWGAMLSFDLRGSTARAMEVGPYDTYVTMHTYLPAKLDLVVKAGGVSAGLRGDGGFACFGVVNMMNRTSQPTEEEGKKAITNACDCGDAMIQAIQRVINPVLVEGRVKGDLRIGVGIDVGDFVATKIGLRETTEMTAYGNCVNRACKLSCGDDSVVVSHKAQEVFPSEKGGKTIFSRFSRLGEFLGYNLQYPRDYVTLA